MKLLKVLSTSVKFSLMVDIREIQSDDKQKTVSCSSQQRQGKAYAYALQHHNNPCHGCDTSGTADSLMKRAAADVKPLMAHHGCCDNR